MSLDPIRHVISLLARLPGIGEKSATRIAFALLSNPKEYAHSLSDAVTQLVERIRCCSICCNLTEVDPCRFCEDPERDHGLICVVEQVPDLLAIERTREYRGVYHVLHGALAPLDGITPDKLRIQELLRRLQPESASEHQDGQEPTPKRQVREIILATNPTLEGEATALYLRKLLGTLDFQVTRIASGVPMGGDLEYIDRATLARALKARQVI